jgi:heme exporter protein D
MFSIGAPEIGLLVSLAVWLTVGLYLLSLARRCVRAVERIAGALEQRERG